MPEALQADPPVADPVAPAVDPAAAPPPAAADPAPAGGNKSPWFLQRIAEESAGRRAADERAATATAEAAKYKALAEQALGGNAPAPGLTAPPQPQVTQEQINAAAAAQRFTEDTTDILVRGRGAYGARFDEAVGVLNSLGVTNDNEFVADIIAVDKARAHEIISDLAKDPERAAMLTKMSSRQRIAELTRMTLAPNPAAAPAPAAQPVPAAAAAPARGISRAPAPAPPVDPSASNAKDWRSDDVSDAEWNAGFDTHQRDRHAARR